MCAALLGPVYVGKFTLRQDKLIIDENCIDVGAVGVE